jgi:hypothetical protein
MKLVNTVVPLANLEVHTTCQSSKRTVFANSLLRLF